MIIRIPASQLNGSEWVDIEVFAKEVHNGSSPGTVGVNGNRLGFSLTAIGLDANPWEWQDVDYDGVLNEMDDCNSTIFAAPVDEGGCAIQNTAPQLFIETLKENYTENISINWSIYDGEMDGVSVVFRLNNSNYSVDLEDCARFIDDNNSNQCLVRIPNDLILYQFNRHDWNLEIIWIDNNSSAWTNYTISFYKSQNFSLWWDNPFLENNSIPLENNTITKSGQNRALLWGVLGVITGVLFTISIAFRALEKRVFENIPDPFLEQE